MSPAAYIIPCLSPDVCLTPRGSAMVPVPYPIVDYGDHFDGYASSVRFTAQKAMVLRSRTTHVHGDEAEPIGHAPQMRAEGSAVIRHLDRFWMNRRNTVGEAVYVKDHGQPPLKWSALWYGF